MSVQTSTVAAAWSALVAAATAAFPAALVCDGPFPVVEMETYADRVTIGWDGDPDAFTPSVTGDQQYNALNRGATKNEDFSIVCSVTHWDGDNVIGTARAAAFGLWAAFERLMRGYSGVGTGDVSLAGTVLSAGVEGGFEVLVAPTSAGLAVTIVFHVSCHARLTGS